MLNKISNSSTIFPICRGDLRSPNLERGVSDGSGTFPRKLDHPAGVCRIHWGHSSASSTPKKEVCPHSLILRGVSPFLIILVLLLTPISTLAVNIPGYEGGIQNENLYKEVIFVTGEPIVVEGTLDIKIKEKDDTITEQYTYKLSNIKKDVEVKRSIKLIEKLEKKGNQITSRRDLEKYKETITIGNKKYEVKDDNYQWNQGLVTHQAPLVGYYAGDWSARKTYVVDKGGETVTVETIGKLVGYQSPWSSTETQTLDYVINHEDKLNEKNNWEGTATVESSHNMTKDYEYEDNVPNQISFKGGFLLTEKQENVLKHNYDLPRFKESTLRKGRNIGKDSFTIDTNPIITRLNIPAVRDVRGLPNEMDIFLLASMEALPLESTNLGPDSPMSRGDFARAIAQSMDMEIYKEVEPKKNKRKKDVVEVLPSYIDVGKNHRNYNYIETVTKADMMQGVGSGRFEPDRPLTRAEATTILIRLLGFQNLAPIKNYSTGYKDNASIPTWAKDHIYMAKELNIIDKTDYFYPNRYITKAEASELIVNFINYLQQNLKYDYRENILN